MTLCQAVYTNKGCVQNTSAFACGKSVFHRSQRASGGDSQVDGFLSALPAPLVTRHCCCAGGMVWLPAQYSQHALLDSELWFRAGYKSIYEKLKFVPAAALIDRVCSRSVRKFTHNPCDEVPIVHRHLTDLYCPCIVSTTNESFL